MERASSCYELFSLSDSSTGYLVGHLASVLFFRACFLDSSNLTLEYERYISRTYFVRLQSGLLYQ